MVLVGGGNARRRLRLAMGRVEGYWQEREGGERRFGAGDDEGEDVGKTDTKIKKWAEMG